MLTSSGSGSSGIDPIATSKAAGVTGSAGVVASSIVLSTQSTSKASSIAATAFMGAGCGMTASPGIWGATLLGLGLGLVL